MDAKEKRTEAMLSLKQARKDLKTAWDSVQHARALLEDMPHGADYTRHQSDSGALWALSNQWSQASSTIRQIIKGMEDTK